MIPVGLPYDSLRLVYPLPNPTTGELRDVIIERLERRLDWRDPETNQTHYKRVVPELNNTEIPWPPQDDPVFNDHEGDTLRIVVERETFQGQALPLLGLPMPPTVIDELRNKYSKLSNRRLKDVEYMAKIEEREEMARKKKLNMMVAMRTPLQELQAIRAENKRNELSARYTDEDVESTDRRYLDIRDGKPWTQKATYDAKQTWKQDWQREQQAARREGRAAKKPQKNPQKLEPLDNAFLERLGAMMEEQGLDGPTKATKLAATA